jgi:8-oxo-dGTP diphosphatase
MTRDIIALVFRCKITGGDLAANEEAAAFRWASETDVTALAAEVYAVRVLDAQHPGLPRVVRQHDGVYLL